MKRAVLFSSRDRRELLIACALGMTFALLLLLLALLLLQRSGLSLVATSGALLVVLAIVLGGLMGVVTFLQRELWQPLNQLLKALPRRPSQEVSLVLDGGIAPLQLLSHRINGLLHQMQCAAANRQRQFDDLAHDIRGPLTRLLLRVETLRDQDTHDPELVAGLEADLEALVALDQELGEIGEQGISPPPRERLPLERFCREIARSYGPRLVVVEIPATLSGWVDRRLLQRTLHNLIENALEHGGAPVRITARPSGPGTVIQLDDTGKAGLASPLSVPLLPPPHHGLGLAIARSFCRSHGGELQVGTSPQGGWQVQLRLGPASPQEPGQ
ncbi:HAMP domain-containing histidine kinase [Synechococcus sp. HJ21-Hayes]|uniref:sensor histidine kinase n=1 Tax=unclassified Synechococcus TaxID=2626047 RepID=UPI0020CE57BB|nr:MULTISPECIES: HAMP domain-containing sensor histidine kinase [unclassified Synechococcus]MCP9832219.1 HAMP domain-containing histidine kinase [Synechococcus sp. JJ3a-Johnson]MCP9853026.1 HAMP domain-containing histidine kinase [Synechococcus sp. HJ21-Hayes]